MLPWSRCITLLCLENTKVVLVSYDFVLEKAVDLLISETFKHFFFSAGAHRDAECVNALMFMIVADNLPLSTPDKTGLRVFANTLQPLFKVPSESTVTRLLHQKYEVMKERVKGWIRDARHICITCDLWTHQHTMKGYLGFTVHFRRGTYISM